MGIPKNITREQVLQAIADLDGGMTVRWGKSRKYDLVYNGRHYAPKAVLGHAICIAKQCDPYSLDFDGGDPTNLTLQELGFEIISKNPYAER
jgi:5-methylcytosine-specific restriction protein B